MKHPRFRYMMTVAAAVIVLLGGCGSGEDQSAEVPLPVRTAVTDLIGNPTELYQANDVLTAQCARARGFDVPKTLAVSTGPKGYADVGGVFRSQEEAVSVGYPTVTVDYDKGMLENEAMLLERHELLEQAMDRAKQVIDGGVTYQTISNRQ